VLWRVVIGMGLTRRGNALDQFAELCPELVLSQIAAGRFGKRKLDGVCELDGCGGRSLFDVQRANLSAHRGRSLPQGSR
jgi:hypothetical protein